MRIQIQCICLLIAAGAAGATHNPLLPRPQQIEYGPGTLSLAHAAIAVPANAAPEDLFAARELGGWLGLPVRQGTVNGKAIRLKRSGAVAAMPAADEAPGPDSRESYTITITPTGADVVAPSSAGLYYAAQTLRQMAEGKTLPEAKVHDWPSLAYRGFMMDLSHGQLLKEEEIRRQIDFVARFKGNQYYFYSELTIELKGYPLINPGARYSQDQVRNIIAYGRERHVDIVPCLEYYGHLHDLFRLERYADMAPLRHGAELNPRHPRTQPLLRDWIGQMTAVFPSPWFHVGLDEPFELEAAGSEAAGGVEPGKLFQEQLDYVANLVRGHGKRMLFWADIQAGAAIFTKYPDLLGRLPQGTIPVPWYYAAKPDYSAWVAPFSERHVPSVIAPGITCWNEIYPDYATTFTNIDGFLAAGRKHGSIGMINTGWTDAAQTIYRMMLPGIAYGFAASWQTAPVERAGFFAEYARLVYPAQVAPAVGVALEKLALSRRHFDAALGASIYTFWDDPLDPALLERAKAKREDLRQSRLLAEDAQEQLLSVLSAAPDTLNSLMLGARMLDYAGMKYLYAAEMAGFFERLGANPKRSDVSLFLHHEIASSDHSRLADLMDTITALREAYRTAWLAESSEYRLGTALGRWDAEYEYWRVLQTRVRRTAVRFREGDRLPALDSLRP